MSEISLRFKLVCTAVGLFMTVAWVVAEVAPPASRIDPAGTTLVGPTRRAGDGTVRAWVRIDDRGNPAAAGVTFSEAALAALSVDEIVIKFPRGTKVNATTIPFDHVVLIGDSAEQLRVHISAISRAERMRATSASRRTPDPRARFRYATRGGRLSFAEPVIARGSLETRANLTQVIQPPRVVPDGWFPTAYSVRHDPTTKEYTVSLEGLMTR